MAYRFALAGNPNCGKTTLFNNLTGSNAHVGNWPGVTVERKEGKYKKADKGVDIDIIDLPGIYSLSPYTKEEIVARDFLSQSKPDLVINIVDATNIERNLYLTTQLIELGIPTILVLNMMDEIKSRGDKIDFKRLEVELGIPVVGITANKGHGVKELMDKAVAIAKEAAVPKKTAMENSEISDGIAKISEILKKANYTNTNYYAVKLLEEDEDIKNKLSLDKTLENQIDAIVKSQNEKIDDIETLIADLRYKYIEAIISKAVSKGKTESAYSLSDKIDRVVTNRILGIPVFIGIMYLMFQIAVGSIGAYLVDPWGTLVTEILPNWVSKLLDSAGASSVVHGLVIDGIFGGLGNVLSFLPQIVLLFMCLSLLEDLGYMARVAFVMDRVFRKFGLSGKAFVPLLMGYGCAVPAIMATRTLEDERSRRLAITLMPFMSCSARIPVYAVFAGAFFTAHQGFITFTIYMIGIFIAMLSCIILNKTVFRGEAAPFVMELPPYRIPTLKAVVTHTWEKAKGYVVKVGTILFAASVVIWLLQSFSFSLQMVDDPARSMFGRIGAIIAPIFILNGFGLTKGGKLHWQIGAALLTGLVAKEAVVSTLGILYINKDTEQLTHSLGAALHGYFTPLTAYSLMVFVLLYAPCVAAISTAKTELNSWKWTLFTVVYQCGIAWFISFIVYQMGHLLGLGLV